MNSDCYIIFMILMFFNYVSKMLDMKKFSSYAVPETLNMLFFYYLFMFFQV